MHSSFKYASTFTATPTYPDLLSRKAFDVATKYGRLSSITHSAYILKDMTLVALPTTYGKLSAMEPDDVICRSDRLACTKMMPMMTDDKYAEFLEPHDAYKDEYVNDDDDKCCFRAIISEWEKI